MEKDFQKYEYKVNDNKARITGAFWNSMAIEVPEKIDGFEVTEIGDYAFFATNRGRSKIKFYYVPD